MIRNYGEEDQVGVYLRQQLSLHQTPLSYTSSVAHKVYGIPQTINTANYVYFLAFQELFTLNNSLTRSEEHDLHAIVNGM